MPQQCFFLLLAHAAAAAGWSELGSQDRWIEADDSVTTCKETFQTFQNVGYLDKRPQTKYNLQDEFCQVYYTGSGDCESLRSQIKNDNSLAVPTITLGDPSLPPMLFFHGWPDTYAMYINQFERFCLPPHGQFYCIAPTWYDFVSASTPTPTHLLNAESQIAAWHSVVLSLGLTNITLVMHDFGAAYGYQYIYRYTNELLRVVILDIGTGVCLKGGCGGYRGPHLSSVIPPYTSPVTREPGLLLQYQQINACASLLGNDTAIREGAVHLHPPCLNCESLTAGTGWPYYHLTNATWPQFTDVPQDKWKFSQTPDIPARLSLLFLYGSGTQTVPRSFCFFGQDYWQYLGSRENAAMAAVEGSEHWFPSEAGPAVNQLMSEWLFSPGSLKKPDVSIPWTGGCPP